MLPAIVVVAFNRAHSLKRLLQSILDADYNGYEGINLLISIDAGGGEEIGLISKQLQWKYGEKRIIEWEKNIGLRNHIIACGELSAQYENVIILEDDCFVSPNFYDYACKAIGFYKSAKKIAGISLYAYQVNENAQLPFSPLADGYSTYFKQVPSSLGQLWSLDQWKNFRTWYDNNPVIAEDDKMPENVKQWPASSWKKYFYKYMVEQDLYFVYPTLSLATNFGDVGTHFNHGTGIYQVPLETRKHAATYSFVSFDNSFNKYDAYFEMLPECLRKFGLEMPEETGVDIFGTKQLALFNYEFLFSIKDCTQPIRSYGVEMFPLLQNIIYKVAGNSIHFGRKKDFTQSASESKIRIVENRQSIGYEYGFQAGSNSAAMAIMRSTSYKLGYNLLHPFVFIKRLFLKPAKKGNP
jgi:hypothetical protein